jgi:hypothetical protein
VLFAQGCADESSSCTAPRLAPNQPNGSSPLAAAMVAMDGQLQQTMQAVMSDPSHSWKGQTLISHALLGLEPTDESMVNDHFESHAPLYQLAIEQFNAQPSASHFNAVVTACENCHLGTCPGPLERIAKRRVEPSH